MRVCVRVSVCVSYALPVSGLQQAHVPVRHFTEKVAENSLIGFQFINEKYLSHAKSTFINSELS